MPTKVLCQAVEDKVREKIFSKGVLGKSSYFGVIPVVQFIIRDDQVCMVTPSSSNSVFLLINTQSIVAYACEIYPTKL
jgi:hypothetical protein